MEAEKTTCAVISGAPNSCAGFLKENIDPARTFVLCADSGYRHCLGAGIVPDLIIGDFDSAPAPGESYKSITLPCVKDDSDTFFCVKKAVALGFKVIEIYNAIGNRADHTWANILCLSYCAKAGVACRIVDEHNKIYTVTGRAVLQKGRYAYFSVFAFLGRAEGVTIQNARYEISEADIEPFDTFGLSNQFLDDAVLLSARKGTLLVMESSD